MKTNITDEELLQEVQTLADKLPPEERLPILELLQRYNTVYSVAQLFIPDYPYGVLDELVQITPCTLTSHQEYSLKSYPKNILQFNQINGEKK